jgi:hypothetical protein
MTLWVLALNISDMSRSRKSTKKSFTCGSLSENETKRFANHKFRRAVSQSLFNGDEVMPTLRQVSLIWSKRYDHHMSEKEMRK